MLSDIPSEFKIEVSDPKLARGKFIPIILAGGKGRREDVVQTYRRLAESPERFYRANLEYYRKLRESTLRVETPDPQLNLAFEWAKIALDSLFVDNPDLGFGMVAGLGMSGTSGRPGFGWFFGGDTYINSLAMLGYGDFEKSRRAIEFLQKFQRDDGKMAHEISQSAGYIEWFKDYPYAYIHADTSPFYIVAAGEYLSRTGDRDFIIRSYPSLKRAFDWSAATDGDGDGLMDNRLAGLGGVEYGELTDIQSDVYLSAVWVKACEAMGNLASAAGDTATLGKSRDLASRARKSFESRFWNGETGTYVFGFNKDGRQVSEISPMCSLALMWGLTEATKSEQTLRRLQSADVTADWGVRILSTGSRHYEPLNYNYGAAWPFQAGWLSAAQFRHDFPLQAFLTLRSTARHTFDNELGAITELFSGDRNIWPAEGVSHQGFSSTGVAFPFVRGLLGLDSDVAEKSIRFSPGFPADWGTVIIENYRVGQGSVNLSVRRNDQALSVDIRQSGLDGYTLFFAPKLEAGARVRECLVDGNPVSGFAVRDRERTVTPEMTHRLLRDSARIEIRLETSFQLLPPDQLSRTGDSDRGVKLIDVHQRANVLRIELEGLGGREYRLPVKHAEKAGAVRGAELRAGWLVVRLPSSDSGQFLRHVDRGGAEVTGKPRGAAIGPGRQLDRSSRG